MKTPFRNFISLAALLIGNAFGGRSRELPPVTPPPKPPPAPEPDFENYDHSQGTRVKGSRRKLQRSNYRRIFPVGHTGPWKNPFRGLAVPNSTAQLSFGGPGEASELAKTIAKRPKTI